MELEAEHPEMLIGTNAARAQAAGLGEQRYHRGYRFKLVPRTINFGPHQPSFSSKLSHGRLHEQQLSLLSPHCEVCMHGYIGIRYRKIPECPAAASSGDCSALTHSESPAAQLQEAITLCMAVDGP